MNEQVLTAKKAVVAELSKRLSESGASIVVGYQGLTVKEMNSLRSALKEVGAKLEVHKNTLMRFAVNSDEHSSLNALLKGQNALVTSSDSIAALPVLFKFAKSNKALVVKGGVVEKSYMEIEQLQGRSKVGSREGALSNHF